jgi:ATP-dependent DNA helicase RecG
MPVDLPVRPLQLEAGQGYADRAVEGGLGPFMQRWAADITRRAPDETVRQALIELGVLFGKYAAASPAARRDMVARAEEAIRALGRAVPRSAAAEPDLSPLSLTAPVTGLRGVSDHRAELLANLGIRSVGDLLAHTPLRYEDRRRLTPLTSVIPGQHTVASVTVTAEGRVSRRSGLTVAEVPVEDGSGEGLLIWFNQPYRATQYPPRTRLLCSGVARVVGGQASIQSPECEVIRSSPALHMLRIVPIYPSTEGLSQTLLRSLADQALQRTSHLTDDPLPPALVAERELLTAPEARRALHFPAGLQEAEAARRRQAYDELFQLQLLLALRSRLAHDAGAALPVAEAPSLLPAFVAALPWPPTAAQERVLATVADDLASDRPALRLIHGDVGSGKTVIAAFALLAAARGGHQAAFLAPTEVLAQQHRRVLESLLRPHGVQPVLLTGSLPARDKDRLRASLAAGDLPVVVGTHALVQESTEFARLAVAVVDEQHRFGVLQRAGLAAKGARPHLFVMTATPIPRTLALAIYGDCDISVLDELPLGRRPPITKVLRKPDRDRAYEAVKTAAQAGHQAFIVCPLIEESESLQADAAIRRHEELSAGALRDLRVGLLHGRLRPEIAADVIERFRRAELDALVATTVIEVGVDVPGATVMVIEDAERFGLAQLHQLRGRVGRGEHQGLCYLITSVGPDDPAWQRLTLLEATSDGFEVAEADLRLRGPGELIGTRQAGLPDLRVASLTADTSLVEAAREDAFAVVAGDPALSRPEHAALRAFAHHRLPTLLPLLRAD